MNDSRTKDFFQLRELIKPNELPFSFRYGENTYTTLPFAKRSTLTDSRIRRTEYTATVDNLSVKIEYLAYQDMAAAEWTIWFTNTGAVPSPVLSDVNALDLVIPYHTLSTLNGDYCAADGFSPIRKTFTGNDRMCFAPEGGRSSCSAWPYQRWMNEDNGLHLAVGWPGQWEITAQAAKDGVHLTAGQQSLAMSLLPGETIRTPRILLHTYTGNEQQAINSWRRLYFTHIMPNIAGSPARPFNIITENGGGEEFTLATEALELKALENTDKLPFPIDLLWIDAGWYPCKDADGTKHWFNTGTWTPDPANFPNGLNAIGKACKDRDMGFLLWFEPERAAAGSELAVEHPDFLLALEPERAAFVAQKREEYLTYTPDQPDFEEKMEAMDDLFRDWGGLSLDLLRDNRLLNLGNSAALDWITQRTLDVLREGNITCYRMDMNFAPLYYWRDNEAADRLGAIENHYIQGLLTFWDTLEEEIPGLFVDSCASGGRRMDLESMRRALPLHHTDYGYGIGPVQQAFRDAMYSWLPVFRGFMGCWDDENGEYPLRYMPPNPPANRFVYENYAIHNAMCPLISLGNPARMVSLDSEKAEYLNTMMLMWRKAANMMFDGDYYALTPFCRLGTGWSGFQFHNGNEGFVQVIRNIRCEQESIQLSLHELEGNTWYFENPETGESFTADSGTITFIQPARQGAVWFYRKR